jgi:hypothetical protein
MSLEVNNNNFSNGLPNGNRFSKYRIDEINSNRIGNSRYTGNVNDDSLFIPSRRQTRGFIPKREFDPTIETPIQKEGAWDRILSTDLDTQLQSSIAAYPQ